MNTVNEEYDRFMRAIAEALSGLDSSLRAFHNTLPFGKQMIFRAAFVGALKAFVAHHENAYSLETIHKEIGDASDPCDDIRESLLKIEKKAHDSCVFEVDGTPPGVVYVPAVKE